MRRDEARLGEVLRRGETREALAARANGLLKSLLGHAQECECVFLDNTVNMCSEAELAELYTCGKCGSCSEELGVVTAAFDNAQHVDVQSAAAKAVGSVCGKDASVLSTLSAALKTSKRLAAIDGLGECRIAGAAQTLADQLGKTKNAKEADRIARALGMLGSSWAWRAIENTEGKARGKEGLEARRIATEALVDGFARFDKARRGHLVGLSMVQYPGLRGIAEQRRGSIDPGAFAQLERIVERVEQRNSR